MKAEGISFLGSGAGTMGEVLPGVVGTLPRSQVGTPFAQVILAGAPSPVMLGPVLPPPPARLVGAAIFVSTQQSETQATAMDTGAFSQDLLLDRPSPEPSNPQPLPTKGGPVGTVVFIASDVLIAQNAVVNGAESASEIPVGAPISKLVVTDLNPQSISRDEGEDAAGKPDSVESPTLPVTRTDSLDPIELFEAHTDQIAGSSLEPGPAAISPEGESSEHLDRINSPVEADLPSTPPPTQPDIPPVVGSPLVEASSATDPVLPLKDKEFTGPRGQISDGSMSGLVTERPIPAEVRQDGVEARAASQNPVSVPDNGPNVLGLGSTFPVRLEAVIPATTVRENRQIAVEPRLPGPQAARYIGTPADGTTDVPSRTGDGLSALQVDNEYAIFNGGTNPAGLPETVKAGTERVPGNASTIPSPQPPPPAWASPSEGKPIVGSHPVSQQPETVAPMAEAALPPPSDGPAPMRGDRVTTQRQAIQPVLDLGETSDDKPDKVARRANQTTTELKRDPEPVSRFSEVMHEDLPPLSRSTGASKTRTAQRVAGTSGLDKAAPSQLPVSDDSAPLTQQTPRPDMQVSGKPLRNYVTGNEHPSASQVVSGSASLITREFVDANRDKRGTDRSEVRTSPGVPPSPSPAMPGVLPNSSTALTVPQEQRPEHSAPARASLDSSPEQLANIPKFGTRQPVGAPIPIIGTAEIPGNAVVQIADADPNPLTSVTHRPERSPTVGMGGNISGEPIPVAQPSPGSVAVPASTAEVAPRAADAIRTESAPSNSPTPPPAAQLALVREVSVQIRDAAAAGNGQKIEVQLNPEELGRVRMSLNSQDTGGTVSILVDRPETLDLMRRHVDQLVREFRNSGWQEVAVSLEQNTDGSGLQQQGERNGAAERSDTPVASQNTTGEEPAPLPIAPPGFESRTGPTTRLNIRI